MVAVWKTYRRPMLQAGLTLLLLMPCAYAYSQEPASLPADSVALPHISPDALLDFASPDKDINNLLKTDYDFENYSVKPTDISAGSYDEAMKPQPYVDTNATSGTIAKWGNNTLDGSRRHDVYINLMDYRSSALSLSNRWGSLTSTVDVSLGRYQFDHDYKTQLGVGGSLIYDVNKNIALVLYGHYYNNNFYSSMAAYPFVGTSNYGGYINLHNDKVGLSLGVNRYYDPLSRRWVTAPVVAPAFKLGRQKIEMDVGPLLMDIIQNAIIMNRPSYDGRHMPAEVRSAVPRQRGK